ncbi:hypothetical protein [Corynebacterium sp. J010B-136]|uniref:hypothetical protein n=1 Tax=Corynebacterium sp. J010B-136 TaxID=2099401 RepID=UPI000CF8BF4E|nr:hypothetical protein [Corynebacterium sp. J010B-136]PQM73542.1 hypothetical protein C5Y44_12265 [Corynebacterium sp. J010B-136]
MSKASLNFHSRVFGFNAFKGAIVVIFAVLTAFFFWSNDYTVAAILAVATMVIAAFNIAVDANPQRIKIFALWIPVRTIDISDIKNIELLSSAPLSERATLGVHILDGSWSYHAGPATMRIVTHSGNHIRVSVDNPEALLALVNSSSPAPTGAFRS